MSQSSFNRVSSFSALYDASYKVCRNVRWKDSTTIFEENRIETILKTQKDLRNCEYKQLVFSCFSIIERGKPRNIRACHINDRLVQNSLCEQALLPSLTPKFIYDNCATLRGKGIDFALTRVKKHLQTAQKQYGNTFYGARIDIRKYFDSIDHTSLKTIAKKVITDPDVYTLCCYLIDTFAYKPTKDIKLKPNKTYYIPNHDKYIATKSRQNNRIYYDYEPKSLGLGSQTSQLFALLTLNEIDHYIKEQLHIKYYGRYMDDLYLLHNDKKYLRECLLKIQDKLAEIGLTMNTKKTVITRIRANDRSAPFKYLKWNFYLTDTNKIIQLPFKKKITQQRRKLRKMQTLWLADILSTQDLQTSYQGWRAHMKKGNTFYIIQNMDNYFRSLFKGVEIL